MKWLSYAWTVLINLVTVGVVFGIKYGEFIRSRRYSEERLRTSVANAYIVIR